MSEINQNQYNDIEIICISCGKFFIWTNGEQVFLNDLFDKDKISSFQPPKRCIPCRQKKKQEYKNKNY